MGKVILSMTMSLDIFINDRNGDVSSNTLLYQNVEI
jgi:hypothetical protein